MMHGEVARPCEEGFTLLETLIAFTILSGALTMMLQGLSIAARQLSVANAAEALQEFASRAAATEGDTQPHDSAGAFRVRLTSENRAMMVAGVHAGTITLRRVEVVALSDAAAVYSELAIAATAIGGN